MKLSTRQQAILTGILADSGRIRANEPQLCDFRGRWEWEDAHDQYNLAHEGIVKTDPARWLKRNLSNSDYVLLSRDYKTLEARGLVVRHKLARFGLDAKTH